MGGGGGFVIPTAPVAHPPPRWRRQPQQRLKEENPNGSKTPRRSALLLLSLTAAAAPSPALSLGFSGPKEWLRDQKKKASRFVLAPIEASRKSLRAAFLLMEDSALTSESSEEVHNLLNSASRDCVPQTRSSIVRFQARTGIEVCTFRLIVRNAASLLDKSDPKKLEAEAMLDDLIRSFSELGSVIDNTDFQLNTDREKVKDGLMDTISTLDKFEQGIKDCLGESELLRMSTSRCRRQKVPDMGRAWAELAPAACTTKRCSLI